MTHQRINVLLIDHDPEIADMLRHPQPASTLYAFEVEYADRFKSGLKRLVAGEIDVVLLNPSVPDATGPQACKEVIEQAPCAAIVAVSDREDELVINQVLEAGAHDYLIKGQFDTAHLVRVVGYVI